MMIVRIAFLLFLTVQPLNFVCAQSTKGYPLQKIGDYKSDKQLDSLVQLKGIPILVVNKTVYVLSGNCIESRSYGSGHDEKTNKSGAESKNEASGSESKKDQSGSDKKKSGSDAERRNEGSDKDKRSGDAGSDKRSTDLICEQRQSGKGSDNRSSGSAKDGRDQDTGADQRKDEKGNDLRKSGTGTDDRDFGSKSEGRIKQSYTLNIKCNKCPGGFEIIDMYGKPDVIYVYDGVSKVGMKEKKYVWE